MSSHSVSPRRSSSARRREIGRLVAATVIAVLITLFAVLNVDKVKVDWIFWTSSTPLIVVIVVSLVAGIVLDRIVSALRRRQRRARR